MKYPSISNSGEEMKPGQLPNDVQIDVKTKDLLLRLLELDPSKRLRSIMKLQTIAFYKDYNFNDVKKRKVGY